MNGVLTCPYCEHLFDEPSFYTELSKAINGGYKSKCPKCGKTMIVTYKVKPDLLNSKS